jgi:uncharacterized protein (DUF58 family)
MSLQLLAIVTATGGMALLALTHNASAEYFMFSVLSALLLVSWAVSRLSTRALTIRRRTSDRVFENEPMTVRLEVANQGLFPRFLLDLKDTVPPFVETDSDCDFVVPALWPGERMEVIYTARALKRGVYIWPALRISASDPFGIFQRYVPVEAPSEATVYPKPLPFSGRHARAGIEASGMATGERARGSESGLDFYGIRDYQPGDELRRIHWPATAHHNRLTVIEFDRGASENVVVVLDTKRGTEFGSGLDTSLEVAVHAAASLLHWALTGEGLAFLACGSAKGPVWAAADRLDGEYELLEVLARVQADSAMPASALLQWAGDRLNPDSNVVLLTAAPDDQLPAVITALRWRSLAVAVVVLDAHSFDPNAYPPAMTDLLEAAGARVVPLHRKADLREALSDVFAAHD